MQIVFTAPSKSTMIVLSAPVLPPEPTEKITLSKPLNFSVRKEEQESALKDQGVNAILIDVEKDSIDDLTEKMFNICFFTCFNRFHCTI
jgi:hypothetical protein